MQRFKDIGLWYQLSDHLSAYRGSGLEWQPNATLVEHDLAAFHNAAVHHIERFNRYGWNAWAYAERPEAIGLSAFLLCHIARRCVAAEQMLARVGFQHVERAETREGAALDVEGLVAQGQVAANFSKGSSPEQRLRYMANALDHRTLLERAVHSQRAWVAVFEDDLVLTSSPGEAAARIQGAIASLPADADCLHLEYCYDRCEAALFHHSIPWVSTAYEPFCSAAILYSQQGLRKLLDLSPTIYTAHDDVIAQGCREKLLNCFKLRKPVFAQDAFWGSNLSPEIYQPSSSARSAASGLAEAEPKVRSRRHDLRWDVPLCRERHLQVDFNPQLFPYRLVDGERQVRGSRQLDKQVPHPQDEPVALHLKLHVPTHVDAQHGVPVLSVKVRNLVERGMYDLFLFGWSDEREILMQQRTLLVEEGATSIIFDVDILGDMDRGGDQRSTRQDHPDEDGEGGTQVVGAKCECFYEFRGTVVDAFPGLSDDNATLTSAMTSRRINFCP